ncbi:MAG TPA: ROK family transcriptional regulator [Anaerolineae bacterium]|nr:ROK family transcriptional regulator [Anaerolineae bacterium]
MIMQKATRQHTKLHNSRLILKAIYDQDDISRADIARLTNLTRATVSSIVADLIAGGLVAETGHGPSVGGKPPRLLNFVENGSYLICLDLSSTCFRGAIVNLRGVIVEKIEVMADGRTGKAALQLVYQLVDDLLLRAAGPILGIGIGSPGLVNADLGVIVDAVNLDWHDVPLQTCLAGKYDHPVYIANDSHLSALAEYSFGPDNTRNLVLIRVTQGIGAGIVLDGMLYYGEGYGAGEIGHVVVAENGRQCSCGNAGCLETVASVKSILQASGYGDWAECCQALAEGNTVVTQLIQQAGAYLGVAVANLIGVLNVRHIVIAGRIIQTGDPFLQAVIQAAQKRVLPSIFTETEIRFSSIDKDIVLLGASALVLSQELGVI